MVNFAWNRWNYRNQARAGFHNSELKWNVNPWNAKNCFQAWIYCKHEFTRMSLHYRINCIQSLIFSGIAGILASKSIKDLASNNPNSKVILSCTYLQHYHKKNAEKFQDHKNIQSWISIEWIKSYIFQKYVQTHLYFKIIYQKEKGFWHPKGSNKLREHLKGKGALSGDNLGWCEHP